MAVLNDILQMKSQGISDGEIIQYLKQQGISPLEISQGFEQARIKSAVDTQTMPPEQYPSDSQMTPSVMQQNQEQYPQQEQQGQYQQEQSQPQEQYMQQQYPQQQMQQQEQYIYQTPQPYYPEYQPQQAIAPDTISEIAEQISDEKIRTIRKDVEEASSFKITAERKLKTMEERLKRIEEIIDKIQASILEKIGEYGENIGEIKDEMKMMQDSFSKALNPLIDKSREKEKTKKSSSGMDSYLRR